MLTRVRKREEEFSRGTAATVATPNHTAGGSSSHDTSANPATPARLPARLSVYARSGGCPASSRPSRDATADADTQKRRQQDEVREVREQADVRRQPADERGFQEQDEKGDEEESHIVCVSASPTYYHSENIARKYRSLSFAY